MHASPERAKSQMASTSSNQADDMEIPGFRYDPEKKKYYRILPKLDCIHELAGEVKKSRKKGLKMGEKMEKSAHFNPAVKLMAAVKQGTLDPSIYRRSLNEKRIVNLRLVRRQSCIPITSTTSTWNECYSLLIPWEQRRCLFGVCSDPCSPNGSRIFSWTVNVNNNDDEDDVDDDDECKSRVELDPEPLWCIEGKITDVFFDPQTPDNPFMLMFSVQTFGLSRLVVLPLKKTSQPDLSDPLPRIYAYEIYKFNDETVWSSCSSFESKRVTVGMEKKIISFDYLGSVIDSVTAPRQNVLGLRYDATGRILYSCTSKNLLNVYDMRRSSKKKPAKSIVLGVPAYQIETLSDSNELVIVGYKNFLRKIDLRTEFSVVSFSGHENGCKRIRANVDENENLLSCADESGVVRLWNLQSGKLLKELAQPPNFDEYDFASAWFNSRSCPPMQMSVTKHHFYIYQPFL